MATSRAEDLLSSSSMSYQQKASFHLNHLPDCHEPGAGSSGGSGNSVGGRIAPLALCEDTGGSCRMPASANGIYGFRPSLGCYNFSTGMGLVPAEFTRDTVGTSLPLPQCSTRHAAVHPSSIMPCTAVLRSEWQTLQQEQLVNRNPFIAGDWYIAPYSVAVYR